MGLFSYFILLVSIPNSVVLIVYYNYILKHYDASNIRKFILCLEKIGPIITLVGFFGGFVLSLTTSKMFSYIVDHTALLSIVMLINNTIYLTDSAMLLVSDSAVLQVSGTNEKCRKIVIILTMLFSLLLSFSPIIESFASKPEIEISFKEASNWTFDVDDTTNFVTVIIISKDPAFQTEIVGVDEKDFVPVSGYKKEDYRTVGAYAFSRIIAKKVRIKVAHNSMPSKSKTFKNYFTNPNGSFVLEVALVGGRSNAKK